MEWASGGREGGPEQPREPAVCRERRRQPIQWDQAGKHKIGEEPKPPGCQAAHHRSGDPPRWSRRDDGIYIQELIEK